MFQSSLERIPGKIRRGFVYQSSEDILPSLRKRHDSRTTKEKEKIQRRVVRHDLCPPFREEQSRPGTPVVGTRLERYASGKGRKTQIPYETSDMYANNGMYKMKQKGSATSRREGSGKLLLSAKRCPTPLPNEKPLTKLCWNHHRELVEEDDSDDDIIINEMLDIRRQHERHFTASTVHINKNNFDVTLSDLENDQSHKPHDPVQLTQKVLQTLRSDNVNKNQRIVQWLMDCEEKSKFTGSQLPSHLPDIMINARHVTSASPSMVKRI
ncbi:uncharacterized protein LOC134713760 [Mytilus trossulus]|uniref:uncharacterized protein LOC134713760 n=1 Tax=Mytilus trossulus TaxID=6551 RepID=UPI003005496C